MAEQVLPQINPVNALAQGMMQSAQIDAAKKQNAERAFQIIGSAAMAAQQNPDQFDAILDDLGRMGVHEATMFKGKPQMIPVLAKASMTALQQIGAAQDDARLDLAMQQFEQSVLNANRQFDTQQQEMGLSRERLDLERQRLNAPQEAPSGYQYSDGGLAPIPGGPADPGNPLNANKTSPKGGITVNPDGTVIIGGQINGEQAKVAGFADRMRMAETELSTPDAQGETIAAAANPTAASTNPLSGDFWAMLNRRYGPNMTQSPEYQRYLNGASEWIRAKLRKESGAAISMPEWETEFVTYFPQPGDAPQVVEQKKRLRDNALESVKKESRGGYEALYERTVVKPGGGASGEITTKEEYDALPSGAEFVWQGKKGRKP